MLLLLLLTNTRSGIKLSAFRQQRSDFVGCLSRFLRWSSETTTAAAAKRQWQDKPNLSSPNLIWRGSLAGRQLSTCLSMAHTHIHKLTKHWTLNWLPSGQPMTGHFCCCFCCCCRWWWWWAVWEVVVVVVLSNKRANAAKIVVHTFTKNREIRAPTLQISKTPKRAWTLNGLWLSGQTNTHTHTHTHTHLTISPQQQLML